MSERFGKCFYCYGQGYVIVDDYKVDCLRCDATGSACDGILFLQAEYDADWEKDRIPFYERRGDE